MASWRPDQPYNDLPPLPPAAEVETRPVLKQCIAARAALAELKQAAELLPNQGVLINALPLLEAQASSEIENIVTTTDRLFQYQRAGEKADPATREALRHSSALLEGYQVLKQTPLNTRTAEQVCSRIKGIEMQVRRVPGTALANQATGEVIYTPPVGEDLLRSKLANWERYLNEQRDVDPLIRMAIPVRGNPPLHRWQRPHWTHSEQFVPDSGRLADATDSLSQSPHHQEQGRVLPTAARYHAQPGMGAVDYLFTLRH